MRDDPTGANPNCRRTCQKGSCLSACLSERPPETKTIAERSFSFGKNWFFGGLFIAFSCFFVILEIWALKTTKRQWKDYQKTSARKPSKHQFLPKEYKLSRLPMLNLISVKYSFISM